MKKTCFRSILTVFAVIAACAAFWGCSHDAQQRVTCNCDGAEVVVVTDEQHDFVEQATVTETAPNVDITADEQPSAAYEQVPSDRVEPEENKTNEIDFVYSLYNNNTEYKVSARNRALTEASIPATYNGLPVTEISDNGFTNCEHLKTVKLSPNIRRIGNNAFCNCINLEYINLSACEVISGHAFALCPKLKLSAAPYNVDSIASYVFGNTTDTVYVRNTESETDG